MQFPGLVYANTATLRFSGTVTTGGTAQIIMPQDYGRYYMYIQNTSSTDLRIGIGAPTGTATVSSGVITGITANNAGLRYSYAPKVMLIGGGYSNMPNPGSPGSPWTEGTGGGLGFQSPTRVGAAVAVMTGSAPNQTIASVTVQDGGAGYIAAPFVYFQPDPRDPYGCFAPSATAGTILAPYGSRTWESTAVCACAVSVYGGTNGQSFEVEVYSRSFVA